MKKSFKTIVCALVFAIIASNMAGLALAASTNLIANNSAETSTNNLPNSWLKGQWGTNNAVFAYDNIAQDGVKSLKITMSNYRSGDAKWYFAPVSVAGGKNYTFSDYYKASARTSVVAQEETSAGALSFTTLGNLTASTSWKNATFAFKPKATTVKTTIFHLIATNGILQTDNFSLSLVDANPAPVPIPDPVPAPTPTPVSSLVSNGDFEQANSINAALPANWVQGQWGTNNAAFSYPAVGNNNSKGAKVSITSYTDGDAKWYFAPQNVIANHSYAFADNYSSEVPTAVLAEFTSTAGAVRYVNLGTAPASPTWTSFKTTFVTGADTKAVSIVHVLSNVGNLTVDNFIMTDNSVAGFNRALVSMTFDDAWANQYINAKPILDANGIKGTFYILTGSLGADGYMSETQVKNLYLGGQELGAHTITHTDLTTLAIASLNNELSAPQAYLQNLTGAPIPAFASPYGAYNNTVIGRVKNYYASHRTVEDGYNSKTNFDPYKIVVQNIEITTTSAQVKAWVDQAIADKTWLVLVYHQVDNSGDQYSVSPANLSSEVSYIKSSGIAAKPVTSALAELAPQI